MTQSSQPEAQGGTLILPLKGEFFNAIRNGSKTEEYRLRNDYAGACRLTAQVDFLPAFWKSRKDEDRVTLYASPVDSTALGGEAKDQPGGLAR